MKTPRGYFVTATGTGAGKTVIAAALAAALKAGHSGTLAIKPIESGCQMLDGALRGHDIEMLEGITPLDGSGFSPIMLRAPLAPMVAAQKEDVTINTGKLVESIRELKREPLIVEGVGGLMVPITREFFVLDLAKALALPLVLISPAGLGAINHTLLSVQRAEAEGLRVAAIVLNHNVTPEGSEAEATNPATLASLTTIPVLGPVPFQRDLAEGTLIAMAEEYLKPLLKPLS